MEIFNSSWSFVRGIICAPKLFSDFAIRQSHRRKNGLTKTREQWKTSAKTFKLFGQISSRTFKRFVGASKLFTKRFVGKLLSERKFQRAQSEVCQTFSATNICWQVRTSPRKSLELQNRRRGKFAKFCKKIIGVEYLFLTKKLQVASCKKRESTPAQTFFTCWSFSAEVGWSRSRRNCKVIK